MTKTLSIDAKYDRPVDVLHLTLGKPQPYEGNGFAGGVEIDYSLETEQPCGAKIVGFRSNGWDNKVAELANVIAFHLRVRTKDVLDALKEAV